MYIISEDRKRLDAFKKAAEEYVKDVTSSPEKANKAWNDIIGGMFNIDENYESK